MKANPSLGRMSVIIAQIIQSYETGVGYLAGIAKNLSTIEVNVQSQMRAGADGEMHMIVRDLNVQAPMSLQVTLTKDMSMGMTPPVPFTVAVGSTENGVVSMEVTYNSSRGTLLAFMSFGLQWYHDSVKTQKYHRQDVKWTTSDGADKSASTRSTRVSSSAPPMRRNDMDEKIAFASVCTFNPLISFVVDEPEVARDDATMSLADLADKSTRETLAFDGTIVAQDLKEFAYDEIPTGSDIFTFSLGNRTDRDLRLEDRKRSVKVLLTSEEEDAQRKQSSIVRASAAEEDDENDFPDAAAALAAYYGAAVTAALEKEKADRGLIFERRHSLSLMFTLFTCCYQWMLFSEKKRREKIETLHPHPQCPRPF